MNAAITFLKARLKSAVSLELIAVAFFTDWFVVSLYNMQRVYHATQLEFTSLNYLRKINGIDVWIELIAVFGVLFIVYTLSNHSRFRKLMLFVSALLYGLYSTAIANSIYYCMGFMVILAMVVIYCFSERNGLVSPLSERVNVKQSAAASWKLSRNLTVMVTALGGILFVIFTGGMTTLRYLEYATPSMDFGVFSQMFHSMATNFQQLTTCERDCLMSHFGVHISPVYYLLLPFYAVYQSPVTLEIAQAVVLALGLIPLYLLARRFRFTNLEIIGISICYSFYPALSMGCFYDLHENAFLPLFLLLLFYFIECDKLPGIIISTLFIFSVKEDAPVYVAFIALYLILDKKKYVKGFIMLIVSILYFMFATYLVNHLGDGVRIYLFSNLIYDDSNSVLCIIKTVFMDPGYVLQQVFAQDNLLFIFEVMAPLCFLPFFVKRWSQLILIGPLIVVNLMSDSSYLHSIEFQYVFGNIGLLFYLSIVNISNLKQTHRIKMVTLMAVFSVLMFVTLIQGKLYYWEDYQSSYFRNRWQIMNEALNQIPEDASVAATTFLVPRLSNHDELYDLTDTDKTTEYVALDLRIATTDFDINEYLSSGQYKTVAYTPCVIGIFKRVN